MHKIIDQKFYLGLEFGLLINKKWITISELLHNNFQDLNKRKSIEIKNIGLSSKSAFL
jgi:hypothetical protein